ncbi:4'-phosphopantetheinyl transferase superfamily protein [Microlunatus speluncae]|uniref:4'-phosphopantetheinyl transferase family protein n=1 Tax=Microlunatus speluncae TaxID=2594267 RepID=UPI001266212F
MIGILAPDGVVVEEASPGDENGWLFGSELSAIQRANKKRRREFTIGRTCARRALGRLGRHPVAIGIGEMRQPIWPTGIVGSLTHCHKYCAAAVAPASCFLSLGIDAEYIKGAPFGALAQVVSRADLVNRSEIGPDVARLLVFSAKEALFKAWYPLGGWLDFSEAAVHIIPGANWLSFDIDRSARMRLRIDAKFSGTWGISDSHVFAVVAGSV